MANTGTSTGTVKSIDTRDFDETINKFSAAINIYREARERIFQSTEALLAVWEGGGKDAFKKEYDILRTKLKDEEDNLNTIKEDLEDCRQTYIDWDKQTSTRLKASVAK